MLSKNTENIQALQTLLSNKKKILELYKHYFPTKRKYLSLTNITFQKENFSFTNITFQKNRKFLNFKNITFFIKTENFHNLECLILQEKSENVIFGKNHCNLGANVTNDAIKVGPPSYKLLI